MTDSTWTAAYSACSDLKPFGSAGLALFVMALRFWYDDLTTIGCDAVVDGPDDKGCDVVYIDRDQRIAIVAQAYRANPLKLAAKDSKAATLRQGISYLLEVSFETVPERLKASASSLRSAISDGDIDVLYVWFVHNCPASANVGNELDAVAHTVRSALSSRFADSNIDVISEELSSERLEKLYTETSTPILVNEPVEFDAPPGLNFQEGEWDCLVVPLKLRLLQDLYKKHKTDLFSANVRDFLGVKAGDSNINFQMQKSLSEKPQNFFVYNNGLTVLTHKLNRRRLLKK